MSEDALRAQLADILNWEHAHASFDGAVADWPAALRGKVPAGMAHSGWQLIEHLRLATHDIYDFCINPHYEEMKWPDDYWPRSPEPPSEDAWDKSIAAFHRDIEGMQKLTLDPKTDLYVKIPHGTGQTILREIVLIIDHNSYHVGQLVLLRRALGAWNK